MSNTITATGNLTFAPELRFLPQGEAVANFTVADTPRRFNRQTNEWEDAGETLFLRCSVWRELAEWAAEHLDKGQRVTVTGRLKQRSWQTPEGENRTVIEADVESIAPHPRRADRQQGGQQAQQQAQAPGPDPWATQPGSGQQTQTWGGGGLPAGTGPHDEPPFGA